MKSYPLNVLRILIVSLFLVSNLFAVKLNPPASQRSLYYHKASNKLPKKLFDKPRPLNNITPKGLSLKGYDPVSYFYGTPEKGSKVIRFKDAQTGIIYSFVSKEHKQEFLRNPDKYIPQVGSWCAYSMLGGKKRSINPKVYKIIAGKIYFFASKRFRRKWDRQITKVYTERYFVQKIENQWVKAVNLHVKAEFNFPYIYETPYS